MAGDVDTSKECYAFYYFNFIFYPEDTLENNV